MSYLEPKIRYMNSVSGSSAGNLPDAEEAYWGYLEDNGPPAGSVAAADITDAGATGVSVIQSATPAAARLAIGVVGTAAPANLGPTAQAGTGNSAARTDHVHQYPSQLLTGRTFSLTGGATGTSAAFTGAANATIPVTLATPTSTARGGVLQAQAQADSVATDVAGLLADFNDLLAKLRTAGVIASA